VADIASIQVFAEGWEKVAADLRGLGKKLQNKVLRQALRSGARPILNAAKANIQSDNAPEWEDTGQLMRSIKIRAIKRSRNRVGIRVGTAEGWFRGNTFYGAFREFGHKIGKRASNEDVGIRKRKRRNANEKLAVDIANRSRGDVRPYKFIEPAYEQQGPQAVTIIEREILAGIEREARSGN